MSEFEDTLRKAMGHARIVNGGFDPSYWPHRSEVQKIAQAIVEDLGINREMIIALIDAIPDGDATLFKQDEEYI